MYTGGRGKKGNKNLRNQSQSVKSRTERSRKVQGKVALKMRTEGFSLVDARTVTNFMTNFMTTAREEIMTHGICASSIKSETNLRRLAKICLQRNHR